MVEDLPFDNYQTRVHEMVSSEGVVEGVNTSASSGKFVWKNGRWCAATYPGVTFITPPFVDSTDNHALYVALADLQQAVVQRLGVEKLAILPLSSFHLTIADLLSSHAYTAYMHRTGAEDALLARVEAVLNEIGQLPAPRLRVVGLSAFGEGVQALLDFAGEQDYERVVRLRDAIYTRVNPEVIERGSPYVAHISLLYRHYKPEDDKSALVAALNELNTATGWPAVPPFTMTRAEFRYFDNMAAFTRRPAWPRYRFVPAGD